MSEINPRPARSTIHRIKTNDSLGNLKLKIPPLNGKYDLDAYMEWMQQCSVVMLFIGATKLSLLEEEHESFVIFTSRQTHHKMECQIHKKSVRVIIPCKVSTD